MWFETHYIPLRKESFALSEIFIFQTLGTQFLGKLSVIDTLKKKVQNVPLEKKKYKTCRFGFGGLIRCRWMLGVQVWVSEAQIVWGTQIWSRFGSGRPGLVR